MEHTRSQLRDISSGVPQGSVLGPLLFVIYFRDLPDSVLATSCLFADDTLVYDDDCTRTPSPCCRLHHVALSLDSWAATWSTKFNASKSAHMLIAGKQTPGASTDVLLSGAIVPQVSCVRHLSSNLSWTPHITAVLSKAAPLAGILKRLAYRCPPGAHRFIARLYCAIVRPRLEYCSPVWGSSCSRQDALSLERLQNSVARALFRSCHPQSTRPRSTTA